MCIALAGNISQRVIHFVMSTTLTLSCVSITAFFFGFFADLALNYLSRRFDWKVGLAEYFAKHRALEAAFIAGGLVLLSMWIGLMLWGGNPNKPHTALFLFVFGAAIDNIFRFGHIMPTLDKMYVALSPPESMFWAGGPLTATFLIAKYFVRGC